MNLRILIEQTSEMVDHLFRPDGQMLTYINAHRKNGQRELFACPMGKDEEIAFRVGVPRMLRKSGNYARWCFFTEAWCAEMGDGRPDLLPAQRADRIEVVIFAAENAKGDNLTARRQIFRMSGQPARLLPLVFPNAKSCFVMEGVAPSEGKAG